MIFLTLETVEKESCEGEFCRIEQEINREQLVEIIDDINRFGESHDWDRELIFRVTLVVEEMVQNVLDHGYTDQPGNVKVLVTSRPKTVSIDIVDDAPQFNPLEDAPEPDLTSVIEERRIGGLGVYFMSQLMDEVTYKYESGQNKLHISTTKVRSQSA